MSSDVTLFIFDSRGKVRIDRWLGGNVLAECLHLTRAPDASPRHGLESWAVQPGEIAALEPFFYADAPTHRELIRWIQRYPAPHYSWVVERDF